MLHFTLQRHLFVITLEKEGCEAALKFARETLGPLASTSPGKMQILRETLMALASPPPYTLPSLPPISDVVLEIHAAILKLKGESLIYSNRLHEEGTHEWLTNYFNPGVAEPTFLTLLRELLCSHRDWFRSQQWQDPFESIFGIRRLLRDRYANHCISANDILCSGPCT